MKFKIENAEQLTDRELIEKRVELDVANITEALGQLPDDYEFTCDKCGGSFKKNSGKRYFVHAWKLPDVVVRCGACQDKIKKSYEPLRKLIKEYKEIILHESNP